MIDVKHILGGDIVLEAGQEKAVTSESDCIWVLAGAGTGKTTTIKAKVKYLVEEKGVLQESILILSFSRKSMEDLEKSINGTLGYSCVVRTFHSLGNSICREITESQGIEKPNKELVRRFLLSDEAKSFFDDEHHLSDLIKGNEKKPEKKYKKLVHYLYQYVEQFEIRGKKFEELDEFIRMAPDDRTKDFLKLCKEYYRYYQRMKSEQNFVSFSDMITGATRIISDPEQWDRIKENYAFRYIFVDEYQDISKIRHDFLKKLAENTKAKLMVVGDDWQSIYEFSGSVMKYYREFDQMIKPVYTSVEKIPIRETRRNSQALVDLAGRFIMQNEYQTRKDLISRSSSEEKTPVVVVRYDDLVTLGPLEKAVFYPGIILEYLLEEIRKSGCDLTKKKAVGLLGRYNSDLDPYTKKILSKEEYKGVRFCTVHASKGLEFQNVILLNGTDGSRDNVYEMNMYGSFGFPSRITDDAIFDSLKSEKDEKILYPEERRLFYVALTRTRNSVYILTPKNRASSFVKEICEISLKTEGEIKPVRTLDITSEMFCDEIKNHKPIDMVAEITDSGDAKNPDKIRSARREDLAGINFFGVDLNALIIDLLVEIAEKNRSHRSENNFIRRDDLVKRIQEKYSDLEDKVIRKVIDSLTEIGVIHFDGKYETCSFPYLSNYADPEKLSADDLLDMAGMDDTVLNSDRILGELDELTEEEKELVKAYCAVINGTWFLWQKVRNRNGSALIQAVYDPFLRGDMAFKGKYKQFYVDKDQGEEVETDGNPWYGILYKVDIKYISWKKSRELYIDLLNTDWFTEVTSKGSTWFNVSYGNAKKKSIREEFMNWITDHFEKED